MYESFYKLTADPFVISPDHRFSFPHKSYVKARAHLEYGLLRGEGLVIVTGVPGTGKSTVINDLLEEYADQHDIYVARLLTTHLELEALLRMVAYTFGIQAEGMDRATVLHNIHQFLLRQFQAGKHVLLIIDEAQHLSEQALEELRLLTNIQLDPDHRFQIFLLGQPQLRNLIRGPAMEQLRQRIVASCHFDPLEETETAEYVIHRLEVAGWSGDPQITDEALSLLHRYSGGIPRKINLLCSRLLLAGAVDEKHLLTADDVEEVVAELPAEMFESLAQPTPESGGSDRPDKRRRSKGPAYARGTSRYARWHRAVRQHRAHGAAAAALAPVVQEPASDSSAPGGDAAVASLVTTAPEMPGLDDLPRPEQELSTALDTERREPTLSEPPATEEAPVEGKESTAEPKFQLLDRELEEVEPSETSLDAQHSARGRSLLAAAAVFVLVFAATYGALWWLERQGSSGVGPGITSAGGQTEAVTPPNH
ncbi:MAG TPA: DUF2075 domain-containing protein [Chromatiales bacterium]|nr:DUF2075 domain-containing protein [Chromatiales bacterium]